MGVRGGRRIGPPTGHRMGDQRGLVLPAAGATCHHPRPGRADSDRPTDRVLAARTGARSAAAHAADHVRLRRERGHRDADPGSRAARHHGRRHNRRLAVHVDSTGGRPATTSGCTHARTAAGDPAAASAAALPPRSPADAGRTARGAHGPRRRRPAALARGRQAVNGPPGRRAAGHGPGRPARQSARRPRQDRRRAGPRRPADPFHRRHPVHPVAGRAGAVLPGPTRVVRDPHHGAAGRHLRGHLRAGPRLARAGGAPRVGPDIRRGARRLPARPRLPGARGRRGGAHAGRVARSCSPRCSTGCGWGATTPTRSPPIWRRAGGER